MRKSTWGAERGRREAGGSRHGVLSGLRRAEEDLAGAKGRPGRRKWGCRGAEGGRGRAEGEVTAAGCRVLRPCFLVLRIHLWCHQEESPKHVAVVRTLGLCQAIPGCEPRGPAARCPRSRSAGSLPSAGRGGAGPSAADRRCEVK